MRPKPPFLYFLKTCPISGRLSRIPGIFYRRADGSVHHTGKAHRICDLDTLPLPAYHRLDMAAYDAFGLLSSRGCPYACRFCSVAPVWDRKTTYRSHDNLIAEIRLLHETYGVRTVLFQDEFFYSSEKKILDFCDSLQASGLDVTLEVLRTGESGHRTCHETDGANRVHSAAVRDRVGIRSGVETGRQGFSLQGCP